MRKLSFNESWKVKKTVTDLTAQVMGGGVESQEVVADLPHDAMACELRKANSPGGSAYGYFTGGDYEYTKVLPVAAEDVGKTFILEFEGIFNRGRVYVNGALAGSVHYGYTSLAVDITPHLIFGADNTVLVKVTNSDIASSRWYTGSGLYRPAWLYVGGAVRVAHNGLKITTPDVSEQLSTVATEIQLAYDGKVQKKVAVRSVIKAPCGTVVAEQTNPVTLFAGSDKTVHQRIYVKNAKLWSVDTPNLYTCEVTVLSGDEVLDSTCDTFGIRSIKINPAEGITLNGQPILLRGGCVHHDNGPVGAANFDAAEERRIRILKEAGFNSVRVSHNSTSKALLNACDKLGMLVMEEIYDVWTQAKSQYDYSLDFLNLWERDVEDMVSKDFNHPSVFMYSIGNEIQDLHTHDGANWNRKLANKVRQLDPTRYVTNAINGLMAAMGNLPVIMLELGLVTMEQLQAMASGGGGGDINDMMTMLMGHMNDLAVHPSVGAALEETYSALDLVGFNYMRGVYEVYKDQYPNMVFYGSETLPPDIDLNWAKVKEIPACLGDYCWTAWDYIGEAGVGIVEYDVPTAFKKAYPCYLAYCGDMDILGHRRPMSYYRQIVWGLRKAPYIAVQLPAHYGQKPALTPWTTPEAVAAWAWTGFEGKHCLVEVYSDAEEVELLINGKSQGCLPAGEANRFKAIFDVVYEPGKVEAVAHYANGETSCFALETANGCQLQVTCDKAQLAAGDIAYLDIALVDAAGNLNVSADRKIAVAVEGAGVLQALASADPRSEENFFDTERTTYYGKAQAVVRSARQTGEICVTVSAEGCAPVTVVING